MLGRARVAKLVSQFRVVPADRRKDLPQQSDDEQSEFESVEAHGTSVGLGESCFATRPVGGGLSPPRTRSGVRVKGAQRERSEVPLRRAALRVK